MNSSSGGNQAEHENPITAEEPRPKVSGKNVKLMEVQAILEKRGPPKVVLTMRRDVLAKQEKEKEQEKKTRERRERKEKREMGKQKRKMADEEEFEQVEEE